MTSRSHCSTPRPALARDVVAAGHVDDEQPVVDQVEREGRGEVVAAALDQDQVERPERCLQLVGRLDVERRDPRGWRCAGRRRSPRPSPAPGRSGRCASRARHPPWSTRSLVITARLVPRAMKRGISCSSSAVLPEPTGPPMPTRAAPGCGRFVGRWCRSSAVVLFRISAACTAAPAAPRFAGSQVISLPSTITSKVCGLTVMFGQASLCSMCALVSLRVPCAGRQRLAQPELALRHPQSIASLVDEVHATGACLAPPNAPHCGRISSGSQVISARGRVAHRRPDDEAALDHQLGLDAEEARPPQHDVGELAGLERADVLRRCRRCARR